MRRSARSYFALTVALTASAGMPGPAVAFTRNVPVPALVGESFTTILSVVLAPGARLPVEKVPARTPPVTFVAPRK